MATVIAILLLVYVGYQVYITNKKGLSTELTTYATVSDTVTSEGFIIREEELIETSYSGVLNYTVSDGTKVSKGTTIADIYSSEEDSAVQSKISRLNNEISILESLMSSSEFYSADSSVISSQINTSLNSIISAVKKGNLSNLSSERTNFQTAVSRKNLITKTETSQNFESRLSELKAEKEALSSSSSQKTGSITAPASGYFIGLTDGFENAVEIDTVTDLTTDKVNELLTQSRSTTSNSNALGKISTAFNWYIACILGEDDAIKLENTTSVKIEIPFATTGSIPAKIVKKNVNHETGQTAVIFKCSNMNADIAIIRNETVKIIANEYSGVLVNEKSIRFENVNKTVKNEEGEESTIVYENVKGVYIKEGDRIKFVQIFTDKTLNGYAICKTTLSEEEEQSLVTSSTIKLYDEVVIGGTDLYDGKIV